MSKQRRGFAAVLLLAGGALILDRFVLGTGLSQPAEAGATASPMADSTLPARSAAARSEHLVSVATVLDSARAPLEEECDPFAVPAGWHKQAIETKPAQAEGPSLYQQLLATHKITSIWLPKGDSVPWVHINGTKCEIGTSFVVGGIELTISHIAADGIELTSKDLDQTIEWTYRPAAQ